MKAFENERKDYKEKELNKLKSMFTLNPQTNSYDDDGDLDRDIVSNFVSEDKDGFIINFGKVTGDFSCYKLGLTSLKGAPTEVGWSFYCDRNQLTSLEGAPKIVGKNFNCSWNNLTSLKGAPRKVGRTFSCNYNPNLHSLDGIREVKGEIHKGF